MGVLRQDAVAQTKEVIKQIPRVQMQYRERVVELRDQVQEQIVVPQVQQVEYIQQPQMIEYVQQPQMVEYVQQPQAVTMAPQTTTLAGGFGGGVYGTQILQ